MAVKSILHVGCAGHPLPEWLGAVDETRFDIDPNCKPDILGDMTAMGEIGFFDIVYCSHALEHLYPHDVPKALGEFKRVLEPGGAVIIMVPDLEDVRATDDVLYEALEQPITGLDLIYGVRTTIEQSLFWAHHTGFTAKTLRQALEHAGFSRIEVKRLSMFNLFGVGVK